jgi:hypothetical protein
VLYLWEAGWIDGVGLAADPHYWNLPDLLELRHLAPSHRVLLQAPILVPNNLTRKEVISKKNQQNKLNIVLSLFLSSVADLN